ncbi:general stress protein [Micromonospora sp. M12]
MVIEQKDTDHLSVVLLNGLVEQGPTALPGSSSLRHTKVSGLMALPVRSPSGERCHLRRKPRQRQLSLDFEVATTQIVGTELRMVEQITGRLTWPRALLSGAASGAWFGVFVGLLINLLGPSDSRGRWFSGSSGVSHSGSCSPLSVTR